MNAFFFFNAMKDYEIASIKDQRSEQKKKIECKFFACTVSDAN